MVNNKKKRSRWTCLSQSLGLCMRSERKSPGLFDCKGSVLSPLAFHSLPCCHCRGAPCAVVLGKRWAPGAGGEWNDGIGQPPAPGRVSPAPSPSAEAFTLADESPSHSLDAVQTAVFSLGLGVCETVCELFRKGTSVCCSTFGPLDISSVGFLSWAFWAHLSGGIPRAQGVSSLRWHPKAQGISSLWWRPRAQGISSLWWHPRGQGVGCGALTLHSSGRSAGFPRSLPTESLCQGRDLLRFLPSSVWPF